MGGDSPGRSGVYQTAFLQLGHTKELRKILKQADEFITDWLDSTGVNKDYAALMIKTNVSTKPIPFQESKQTTKPLQYLTERGLLIRRLKGEWALITAHKNGAEKNPKAKNKQ